MKRQLAIWKQLLVIVILCGAGYAAWDQRERISELTGVSFGSEAAQEPRGRRAGDALPVIVERVDIEQAIDRIQSIGDGRAKHSITIYPEVSGIVAEMNFEAGDRIASGEVIVSLNSEAEKIAVAIAEAQLANARRTMERYEELLKRDAMAEAQVDTARTALRTAELQLDQAQESLSERTIRAPFDGVVGIPQVEAGDRVAETTAITSFDDRSVIIVEFDVPEIYHERLKIGQRVTATNAGFRDREFPGRITQINSRVDQVSRSVRLRAEIDNSDDMLRGGMSFTVNLVLEGREYPAIAELALLWERDGAFVWAVEDGKASKVAVSVVKRAKGRILVDGDLAAGQLIVVEGTQRLRPGREVAFDQPSEPAQAEAGL